MAVLSGYLSSANSAGIVSLMAGIFKLGFPAAHATVPLAANLSLTSVNLVYSKHEPKFPIDLWDPGKTNFIFYRNVLADGLFLRFTDFRMYGV